MADIDVFYKRSNDFRTIPVSGVWGGVTAPGMISAEFFVEKPAVPEHTVIKVDENGVATELPSGKREITREILVGVIITPEMARIIGNFLIARADEIDKFRDKK